MKVVHVNKEPYDVYIGRPSKWSNPYTHIKDKKTLAKYVVDTREEAIQKFREYIETGDGKHLLNDLHELKDKTLGCWCHPESCHGDILLELVDKYCYEEERNLIKEKLKKHKQMNCTLEEYIEDAKSQLTCNQTGPVEYITYDYTNEEVDKNKDYFEYTLSQNLSAYKALLFLHDYLTGEYIINPKSYQMVEVKDDKEE